MKIIIKIKQHNTDCVHYSRTNTLEHIGGDEWNLKVRFQYGRPFGERLLRDESIHINEVNTVLANMVQDIRNGLDVTIKVKEGKKKA